MKAPLAALLVALTLSASGDGHACRKRLTPAMLDRSIALGAQFMLENQRPAGNFAYEYDWKTKRDATADSEVRQAGAAWGLTLVHADAQGPLRAKLRGGIDKALAFFRKRSRVRADGARYIRYPGSDEGRLGTVALVALAHIDLLRADPKAPAWVRTTLDGYLKFLVAARRAKGGFHAAYDDRGTPRGKPSPYFDGEALLAITKAARYAGRRDLAALALTEADMGHRRHVVEPRRRERDPAQTKGYYQWSSMAYAELAASGWPGAPKHRTRLMDLADWMIDTHRTLRRRRNTGYAYEGIVPAWVAATETGDKGRARKFRCIIDRGLHKLISWQVGGPVPNRFIDASATRDRRALGGVQNHVREPGLRIDVAQHQLHALVLARRHLWPAAAAPAGVE